MDPPPLFSPSLQPQKEKVIRSIFGDITNKSNQENSATKPSKPLSKESKIKKIRSIFGDNTNVVNQQNGLRKQLPGSVKLHPQSPSKPRAPDSPKSSCNSDCAVFPRTPSPEQLSKKENGQQNSNNNSNGLPLTPPGRKSCNSDNKSHYSVYSTTDSFYSAQSGISPVKMALSPNLLSPRGKSKYSFEYVSNCNSQDELEKIVKTLESHKNNRYSALLKAAYKRINHVRERENTNKCTNNLTPKSRDTNLSTTQGYESSLIMSLSTTMDDDFSNNDSPYYEGPNKKKQLNDDSNLGSILIEGLNKVGEGLSTGSSKKEELHLTQEIETLTKRIQDLQLAKYEQETSLNKKVCDLEHARQVAERNVNVLEQAVQETNEAAETIRMSMAEIQEERDALRENLEMQKEKQRQYSANVESTQAELRTQIDSLSSKLETDIDLGPILEELENREKNEAALNVSLEETKSQLQAVQQEQCSMLSVLEKAMYGDAALAQSFDKGQGQQLVYDISQKLASSKLAVKAFAEAMSSTELDRQEVKDKLNLAEKRIQELKRIVDDLESENIMLQKQNMNLTKQLEEVKLLSENQKKQEEQYENIIQHLRKTISKKENVVSLAMYKSAKKEADDLLLQVKDRDAQIDALQSNLIALQQNLIKTGQIESDQEESKAIRGETLQHAILDESDTSTDNDPNRTYDLIEFVKRNLDQAKTRNAKCLQTTNFQDCKKPLENELDERLTPFQQAEPCASHRITPESSDERNTEKMRDPPSSLEKCCKGHYPSDVELFMPEGKDDITLPSIIENHPASLSSSPPFSVSHLTSPILSSPTPCTNFYSESPPIIEHKKMEQHDTSSIDASRQVNPYYDSRCMKLDPNEAVPGRLEPQGELSFVRNSGRNRQLRDVATNKSMPLTTSNTDDGKKEIPQRSRHWFFLTVILASTNLYLILNQNNFNTAPFFSLEPSLRSLRTNDEVKGILDGVEFFTLENDGGTRSSMIDMSVLEQNLETTDQNFFIDPDLLGKQEGAGISKVAEESFSEQHYDTEEISYKEEDTNTETNNDSIYEDALEELEVLDNDDNLVEEPSDRSRNEQKHLADHMKELKDITNELVRKRAIDLFLKMQAMNETLMAEKYTKSTNSFGIKGKREPKNTNNQAPARLLQEEETSAAKSETEVIRNSFKKIIILHHDEESKNAHNEEKHSLNLRRNKGPLRRKKHNFISRIFSRKDTKNSDRVANREKRRAFITKAVDRVKVYVRRALRNTLQQLEHKLRNKLQQLENGM